MSEINWTSMPFIEDYVYLSTDAARYLQQKEISLIGIDYLSVGGPENGIEVHRILLGNSIWIVEGLNLREIKGGLYEMV
jgi:arylformamidase